MKEFFIGLIVGAVLALATAWYFAVGRNRPDVRHAQDITAAKIQQTAQAVDAKLTAWHLTNDDIKQELAQTGKVVRRSAREWGAAAADAASDTRITAAIKTKLVADKELSAWTMNVNTTDGHVTLSGTVPAHRLIGRAIMLAMETPSVRQVSSTLQVKK